MILTGLRLAFAAIIPRRIARTLDVNGPTGLARFRTDSHNGRMATGTTEKSPAPTPPSSTSGRKPEWAPRIWEGCDFFAWFRLLFRNGFAVQPKYIYIAVIVSIVSFFHTVARFFQDMIFGRRVRATAIKDPPIFIIGHWRTGTTLLHEFLVLDERHTFPTYYECLSPNDFLVTESVITRWLSFLMPNRRPMDNMKMGWDRPQEDEFALCMLGARSPYLTIAFPNHRPVDQEYFELENVSDRGLRRWKRAFTLFVKRLTFKKPGRLVLKSPPHTCRIKVLQHMFPGAIFIHIMRDPYVVFPSTVNLWKTLYRTHGLQTPNFQGLEEYVFSTYTRIYDGVEQGRRLVDVGRFYELKYEDLIRDPVAELQKMYAHLNLGGFERFLPRLQAFLATIKGYETNKYQLTAEQRDEITRRWRTVIDRYGYS
jgi:omega-hydroxy-beta-dihydromenaquinone-9 sulfotransferase